MYMREQRGLKDYLHNKKFDMKNLFLHKKPVFVMMILVTVLLLTGTTVFISRRAKNGNVGDNSGAQNSQISGEGDTAEGMAGAENVGDESVDDTAESVEGSGILCVEDLPETDLNRNGIPEELRIVDTEEGDGKELEVWENGERILREVGFYVHTGQKAIFLCRVDGEDYLLRYRPTMYQGCGDYDYALFTMENNGETTAQWNAVSFDINFGSPIHGDFEPEEIAAFMEEVNGLLAESIPLIVTDDELIKTFEKEGMFRDTLWWLDRGETGFIRDSSKSLAENLRRFEAEMSGKERQEISIDCDTLPFERGMEMRFSSGVGAWRTMLMLQPDGSFAGEYTDSDAGWTGEDYPCGTVSVCRFHGRFGGIRQISPASYSLMLEELEIDTEYPVGEEWIEDEIRYISSEPYGLDGMDSDALKPGASFLFYTPQAKGYVPGSELYGAAEFCSWMPERREFQSESDKLGCYGLHNLEMDYGFFSTGVMEADFDGYFDGLQGAAVLYDAESEEYTIYNRELAERRTSPCSTFKIVSSCIALENGLIDPDHSLRRWSGEKFWNEKWNRDIDFKEAFRESCVWYFREVIDEIGPELMQEELSRLGYGNHDISDWEGRQNTNNSNPALTGFWIESSLAISPVEQTEVMERIFGEDTVYSEDTRKALREVMRMEENERTDISIYGKTGMGKAKGVTVDAWYTGFAEKGEERIYFCVYLGENGDENVSSQTAREIAVELMEDYFDSN